MTGKLLIIGCGGHGRVVADAAMDCGYDEISFLDDNPATAGRKSRHPVLGPIAMLADLLEEWPAAIIALGNNLVRLELFFHLRDAGFATPSILHPTARISRSAVIGEGVYVAPGAVINIDARIGEAVIVNTGACIDHDCIIGEGAHIAPGVTLSGSVTVGACAWLGTGCSVRQNVTIGERATVGVGAAVVSDLTGDRIYVGCPARPHLNHL